MGSFRLFVENHSLHADDILKIIRNSPQHRNAPDNYDWDRYRERWAVQGDFIRGTIAPDALIKLHRDQRCQLSKVDEQTVLDRMKSKRYNTVVITSPDSYTFPLVVMDGTHSLIAAWRNKEKQVPVIASLAAANYLGNLLTHDVNQG